MSASSSRFASAFDAVLAKDIDRAILVALRNADRELRYEELRRAVGSPRPQTFQYALDRLMKRACVARRLEPRGAHHASHYRTSSRGAEIATLLIWLAKGGSRPAGIDPDHLGAARRVLLGAPDDVQGIPTA